MERANQRAYASIRESMAPGGHANTTAQPFPLRGNAIARRWEVAAVVTIILVAAVLRFWHLSSLPAGLHGDEAWTGLEAQRILEHGWIGPYSPGALGQPSGPMYLTAVAVWLFGNSVFAARVVSALLGLLTVAALYFVLRRNLDIRMAIVGAAFLAIMAWHVHFARVGFPLEAWPLAAVLATGTLMEALRRDDWRWWAAAGTAASLGIYTYNAHPLFLAIFGGYALFNLLLVPAERFTRTAAFGAAVVIIALPMISFAANPANGYIEHPRLAMILNKPEWTSLSVGAKSRHIAQSYVAYWDQLAFRPRIDGTDGTGVTAIVPAPFFVLALLGVGLALYGPRKPLVTFGLLVVLLMPFAAVFAVEAQARRTIVSAPFMAMFAALAVVELLRVLAMQRALVRRPATSILVAVVALSVLRNVKDYFGTFAASPFNRWVFAAEITDASRFMARLEPGSHVYFYSGRWSVNYETRRYLAPNVEAEDRSTEFGKYSLTVDGRQGRVIFVLLAPYEDRLPLLRELYPDGRVVEGGRAESPSFVAYDVTGSP